MGLRQALALAFVAALAALGAKAYASHDASPGRNGLIAVSNYRDGPLELVSPKGGVTKRVKLWSRTNYDPAWSPDGQRLAYGHLRGGGEEGGAIEAWLADPSGRPLKRLVNETESVANCGSTNDNNLSWSPSGSRLVFSASRIVEGDPPECEHVYSLWTVSSNGGGLVRLIGGDEPRWFRCYGLTAPAWSSKGEIAFSGSEFLGDDNGEPICRWNIFVVNADGSGLRQLTHTTKGSTDATPDYTYLEWSPNGQMLLFARSHDLPLRKEHVIRADGTGERIVARATWAPNGRGLGFVATVARKFKTPYPYRRYISVPLPALYSGTVDCAVKVAAQGLKRALKGPACRAARALAQLGPRNYYELTHAGFGGRVAGLTWQPLR
jgi:Tol biopolymer transport system component